MNINYQIREHLGRPFSDLERALMAGWWKTGILGWWDKQVLHGCAKTEMYRAFHSPLPPRLTELISWVPQMTNIYSLVLLLLARGTLLLVFLLP